MEENQESQGSKARQAVRPLLFAAAASGAAVFLLSSGGFVHSRLGLDLSFLIVAFVGYYAFRLASRLCYIFLPSYHGPAAQYVFSGLAFSFFFYHLLGRAMSFTRLPGLEESEWFFATLSTTTGYVVLFIAGCVLSRLAGVFHELPLGRRLYPAGNALGQFVVGLSMWQFFACFSDLWHPMSRIGQVLFAGMLAVSLSTLGAYGERARNIFVTDASRWLKQAPHAKFCLGALIACYIIFVRPAIVGVFYYAPLVEWGLVCALAWRLFEGVKSGFGRDGAVVFQNVEWRRHMQQVRNRQDADFTYRSRIQRGFVDDGVRDPLLRCLASLMDENRLTAAETDRILHPLMEYQDVRAPWFACRWGRRRVERRNRRNRQCVLDEVMGDLKGVASSVYHRRKERRNDADDLG